MRATFYIIRMAVLLSLLGFTFYLYQLGQQGDPRFFAFLQTRPGAALSELFGWDAVPLKRVTKTEAEMSGDELALKKKLEKQVKEGMPSDRIILRDGRKYEGHIISEKESVVVFEERYGRSGGVEFSIPRKQIERIERDVFSPPSISYRDVRFQMEFPELKIFRRPPYTIATELEFFEVEKTVRDLNKLYREVVEVFEPAVGITNQMDSVQLLYFKEEEDFFSYRDKHAAHLGYSSAYYSPSEDRFVLYHHPSSSKVKEAKARVNQTSDQYQKRYRDAGHEIRKWEDGERNRIDIIARNEATRTLRHEGAHQLFYALGVHSHIRSENIWLIEGLAVYCEEKPLGRRSSHSSMLLRSAVAEGRLVSFADLINHRSLTAWGELAERMTLDLAYAQSWVAVHFLMQDRYREGFFNYMIQLRESGVDPELIRRPRIEVLAESLNITVVELERLLTEYAQRM